MSIYALRDPRTGVCRYVGRSHRPESRFRSHLRRPHSAALRAWVDELKGDDLAPNLEILGEGSEADWIDRLGPDLNVEPGDETEPDHFNNDRLDLRLPSAEKALFARAAEADGLTISTWVRRVARAAARKLLGDAPAEKKPRPAFHMGRPVDAAENRQDGKKGRR